MRKIICGIALVVTVSLTACSSAIEKKVVDDLDATQKLIFPEYLDLCKKSGMTDEKLKNRQLLVKTAQDDVDALMKAVK